MGYVYRQRLWGRVTSAAGAMLRMKAAAGWGQSEMAMFRLRLTYELMGSGH